MCSSLSSDAIVQSQWIKNVFKLGEIPHSTEEWEIDEEVLSEIRNNLMSPTDIDPFLISHLQGVRIRTTGFPTYPGLTDQGRFTNEQSHR